MSSFMFLFRAQPADLSTASPEQMERQLRAWVSWLDELKEKGKLVQTGNRLAPEGKVVRGKSKSVMDGPFAEAKDTVGGFIVVAARDLEEAAELAKGCPLLERDGAVEVRPLMTV